MEKSINMRTLIIFTTMLLSSQTLISQTNADLQNIITYGSLAPNSHNAQMWKVSADTVQNKIEIELDSNRLLSQVDPQNREAWISCGSFAQNCIFAAQSHQYECEFSFDDDRICLSVYPSKQIYFEPCFELIKKRKTIRKPFSKTPISEKTIDEIVSLSSHIHYIHNATNQFDSIVSFSQKANTQQMNNKAKMQELAEWMRFSEKEFKKKQDGLSLRNLGMNSFERFVFRLFVNRNNFAGKYLLQKQSINTANKLYSECAGYLIITSESQSVSEWIEVGMLLQKIWLFCVENGISVHPMSQVIEEEPFYSNLKKSLIINEEIQMLLRVGYE